ncbi:hypothetical protein [Streptomyces sp. NPDC060065]|uniref:hypothetical protein n=1 Tax=Streptomyces sp. NPDC060065 TaxID=3347050 RepID=UPI00369124CA
MASTARDQPVTQSLAGLVEERAALVEGAVLDQGPVDQVRGGMRHTPAVIPGLTRTAAGSAQNQPRVASRIRPTRNTAES